ncbi:MAG: ParM/StbA family protein [Anaerolineae bacterium]|nr:ParM/StbA family protein [Anaerolineae bacterium]
MKGSVQIESVVGIGSTDLGLLSLHGNKRRTAQIDVYQNGNGETYLIGAQVRDFAQPIERLDFLRVQDSPELRALTFTALGKLLSPDAHTIAVNFGLPNLVMLEIAQAQEARRNLRNWLLGTHQYRLNDQVHTLTISAVDIMAQPAGAYAAFAYDDQGRLTLAPQDREATIAICDIGFNTVDVLTLRGTTILKAMTGGNTAGMRRAAEVLMQSVQERYGIALSRHQADHLLRQPRLETNAGFQDLSREAELARQAAAGGVIDYITGLWGSGRQISRLLFTGGGAEALRKELLQQYPHGQVLPEPVLANALGLARHARRRFKEAAVVVGLDPGFGAIKAVALG